MYSYEWVDNRKHICDDNIKHNCDDIIVPKFNLSNMPP